MGDVCFATGITNAVEHELPGVNVIAWMSNSNAGIAEIGNWTYPAFGFACEFWE